MKSIIYFVTFILGLPIMANAQYGFSSTQDIECTEIKSQGSTGTCWSFATSSFLESELIRMGKDKYDISEMYVVREIYKDKARNYILRQGKANFSQGSLSHDVINVLNKKGIMPQSAYQGKTAAETRHNHNEMEAVLKGMLDGVLKQKRVSDKWMICLLYTSPSPRD